MARFRATWLTRLLPWLVAIGILAFVITRVPYDDLVAALARVSLWRLGLLAVGFVFAMLAADSLALWIAFRKALGSALPYRTVVAMRGASYLLGMINYAAGQGGIVYLLRERHEIPVAAGAAAVALASGLVLLVACLAVSLGLMFGAIPEVPTLRLIAASGLAVFPLYLVLVAARPQIFTGNRWLAPLFSAGVGGTLLIAAARALHLSVLVVGHFTAMKCFGIDVPVAVALAGLPVLFLIAALPISLAGLGTTQAAAITLFSSFAPGPTEAAQGAVVLAYSLSFQVAGSLVVAVLGLTCLRRLTARV